MNHTGDVIHTFSNREGIGRCINPLTTRGATSQQKLWAETHCQGEWICSQIYAIDSDTLWLFEHEADRLLFALRWSDRGK
jgi:hypothetical protein